MIEENRLKVDECVLKNLPNTVFKKGMIPWNKGLTKEIDKRVKGPPFGHGGYTKPNPVMKNCIQCQKQIAVYKSRANRTKFCSRLCYFEWIKENGRVWLRGEKNWNWKGGVSRDKHKHDLEYLKWRKFVFERDSFTCQECCQKGGYLQAHHILSWSKFPELRYIMSNGITLCIPCHKKTDNYAGKQNRKII